MAGPAWGAAEPYQDHVARLGARPPGGPGVLEAVKAAGLRGRGGARFPAGRKWEAVAAAGGGAVLVNAAEGEPASRKDELLLISRPHLVIDGAELAAETVCAREIAYYVNRRRPVALASLQAALRQRPRGRLGWRIVEAPDRYVAGEESAAVNLVNGGDAKPVFTPPRPYQKGVGGRPTLVHNVETLAYAALLSRLRSLGEPPMLVTVSGAVARPGVYEVPPGTPVAALVERAGGSVTASAGLLTGGYFGSFVGVATAAALTFDDASSAASGARLGCGVVHVLPAGTCPLRAAARILSYLGREGAQQCGPCINGIPALATALTRIAEGVGLLEDHINLERWTGQLASGRGACRLPDGAVGLLASAVRAFGADLVAHRERGACGLPPDPNLPLPVPVDGWR